MLRVASAAAQRQICTDGRISALMGDVSSLSEKIDGSSKAKKKREVFARKEEGTQESLKSTNAKIDNVGLRLNDLEDRINGVSGEVVLKFHDLNEKINDLSGKIDLELQSLSNRIQELEKSNTLNQQNTSSELVRLEEQQEKIIQGADGEYVTSYTGGVLDVAGW